MYKSCKSGLDFILESISYMYEIIIPFINSEQSQYLLERTKSCHLMIKKTF